MTEIFRRIPPEELTLQIFECVGIRGFFDEREFSKKAIKVAEFDALLPILEPYYKKYKRFMCVRAMQPKYYIQIIRNLCQAHGFIFYSKHTDSGTVYRILNPLNPDTSFYTHMLKEAEEVCKKPFILSFA